MAEATGTNLTVPDQNQAVDNEPENKSGFMDTLGSADMMRQMALVVVLVICVAIAIFILIWSQEPDYRPLAKMETQELIETLDYMDANQIDYKLEGNIVYVRSDEFQNIRLGMTRQGLTKALAVTCNRVPATWAECLPIGNSDHHGIHSHMPA